MPRDTVSLPSPSPLTAGSTAARAPKSTIPARWCAMNSTTAAGTTHHLKLPITEQQSRSLRVGDLVYLSGDIVISIGMPTHQRILTCLENGEPLPLDLNGAAMFQLSSYNREVD